MRSLKIFSPPSLFPLILFFAVFILNGCSDEEKARMEAMKEDARMVIEEAWNKSNFDVLDEICSENYIYHIPPYADIVGLEAYKNRITEYRIAFPDFRITIVELIVEGNIGAMKWKFEGTHEGIIPGSDLLPSGKSLDYSGCVVTYWRNGKMVESWNYANFLSSMQQLGYQLIPPETETKE